MVLLDHFFVSIFLSKSLWAFKSFKNSYQSMQMIDILLKYILWNELLNDLNAQSDFDKKLSRKSRSSRTILILSTYALKQVHLWPVFSKFCAHMSFQVYENWQGAPIRIIYYFCTKIFVRGLFDLKFMSNIMKCFGKDKKCYSH